MATNQLGGLYTGGAVTLNSQPLASQYHQFVAKKMAQDDALDNYFRDYGKNINPAGMRQQDVEGLMQKQNEWNQFYQQNKAAIKNPRMDNGRALTEYQARYQDQLAYIDKSKERVEVRKQMGAARLNPNLSYIFDDPEILKQIHEDDLPLNDPNHKPIDIYQLNVQPKPFGAKEREQYNKSVTAGLKPSESVKGIVTDPNTKQDIVTYESSYSPQDLATIGNRARTFYQSDPSIKNYANKNLTNPAQFEQLNEVYQKVYGKPAETPADLFVAETIANSTTTATKQKANANSLARSLYIEGVKQGNRTALINLRHQYKTADKEKQADMENGLYDEVKQSALKNPRTYKAANGTTTTNYVIDTTPDVDAMFAKKDSKGHDVQVDQVVYTPDGFVKGLVFKRVDDGQGNLVLAPPNKNGDYEVDDKLTTKMTEREFRARYVKSIFGVKEAKAETVAPSSAPAPATSAPKKHPLPMGQPRSVKQNGHVYTWSEEKGEYE